MYASTNRKSNFNEYIIFGFQLEFIEELNQRDKDLTARSPIMADEEKNNKSRKLQIGCTNKIPE